MLLFSTDISLWPINLIRNIDEYLGFCFAYKDDENRIFQFLINFSSRKLTYQNKIIKSKYDTIKNCYIAVVVNENNDFTFLFEIKSTMIFTVYRNEFGNFLK